MSNIRSFSWSQTSNSLLYSNSVSPTSTLPQSILQNPKNMYSCHRLVYHLLSNARLSLKQVCCRKFNVLYVHFLRILYLKTALELKELGDCPAAIY
jgi:hypothetical protein